MHDDAPRTLAKDRRFSDAHNDVFASIDRALGLANALTEIVHARDLMQHPDDGSRALAALVDALEDTLRTTITLHEKEWAAAGGAKKDHAN